MILIPALLSTQLFTSVQYCSEMMFDLNRAVEEEIITQDEMEQILHRCNLTYTKGL